MLSNCSIERSPSLAPRARAPRNPQNQSFPEALLKALEENQESEGAFLLVKTVDELVH